VPPFRILDTDTRAVIKDALDSFLLHRDDGGLGQTCTVTYPPKQVRCDNCVFDPTSNRSSNRPSSGAPVPFQAGSTCPLCSGRGLKESAATEDLTLKVNWEFKKFVRPPADLKLRQPHSVCEVKSFMVDLPKLLKADSLLINLDTQGVIRHSFVLMGEPGDPSSMVPGRYALSYWERKKK